MAVDPNTQPGTSGANLEPPNIDRIEDALREMYAMSVWGDDWDGEDSLGYTQPTLDNASTFLVRCARDVWQRHGRAIPVPEIGPGPNGSIDFHWKTEGRELLLNLPAKQGDMVDFYGDTTEGEAIKGKVHASTVGPWLLAWLTQ